MSIGSAIFALLTVLTSRHTHAHTTQIETEHGTSVTIARIIITACWRCDLIAAGAHDGLLHPHLRHCSSPASAVRRLPSAVRTATPAFHVRSLGLFRGRPGGLELVTRLPARSVTFLRHFSPGPETFSFLVLPVYTAH